MEEGKIRGTRKNIYTYVKKDEMLTQYEKRRSKKEIQKNIQSKRSRNMEG